MERNQSRETLALELDILPDRPLRVRSDTSLNVEAVSCAQGWD